ncbi:MAG: tRNA (cytidine(34)-2'-O)-methyltransferase [bacterium]
MNQQNKSFNIVLFQPEIPQNTGNIVRLCSCTNSKLYLVGKLGFQLTDKYLKRAGLDYWDDVDIKQIPTLEELIENNSGSNFYYLTTKTKSSFTDIKFKDGDFLVFGSETKGLPSEIIEANPDKTLTIPMFIGKRSLNLSNSVSIVLYEALRQNNFWD